MASRMERYNNQSEGRSKKNEHLYQQIDNISGYSNIEGIADIPNSNEISINTVKEMLKSREEYQKRRGSQPIPSKIETIDDENEETEEKTYDIQDILNKAKVDHSDSDVKYRNLKNEQYDILRNIKVKNPDNDDNLQELTKTLTFNTLPTDDLGMFDDLKSNTMVGDASSIKKILDDAKKSEEPPVIEEVTSSNLANIDNTFYTSSFSFSDKDFEDIRNLDNSLKRNNKLIKVLIVIFSVLLAVVIVFVVLRIVF